MGDFAALAEADDRAAFITKTYVHLFGAIALFAGLETVLITFGIGDSMLGFLATTRFAWLIVLGAFMLVSTVASDWAVSGSQSRKSNTPAWGCMWWPNRLFLPCLTIANQVDPSVIPSAAMTTLALFGGLTVAVFITRKDFSFLRTILVFGGFAAMGFILVAILFNFQLGAVFSLCHDCPGLRIHSLRHFECSASLSHWAARGRSVGAVRLGGLAVLVSRSVVPVDVAAQIDV